MNGIRGGAAMSFWKCCGRNTRKRSALPLSPKVPPVQIAFPDTDGRFGFADLRPVEYRIAVRPADMESAERWVPGLEKIFEVEVAGGTATEVELPVATY